MSSLSRRIERRILERQNKFQRICQRIKGLTHRQAQRGKRSVN